VNGVAGTPASGVTFIPNQDKNLRIGAGRNEVTSPAEVFQGNLDEVALYSVALSQATVAERFAVATS
jgi:hypothetical protein